MDSTREKVLPSLEERRRILEQAGVILAEARALAHFLDDQRDSQIWAAPTEQLSFEIPQAWAQFSVLERSVEPLSFI
jgi:hypothetical protein